MCFNWTKEKTVAMAKAGGLKFYQALNKFIKESNIINEINERVDKEVFLPVSYDRNYKYIADIREEDFFDNFVELCLNASCFNVDVENYVSTRYSKKSKKAQKYIADFLKSVQQIIFDVLKKYASPETKLILNEQQDLKQNINSRFDKLEDKIACYTNIEGKSIAVITYSANMQNKSWNINGVDEVTGNKINCLNLDLSVSNSIMMPENGEVYWSFEQRSLINNFEKKVIPLFDDIDRFYVFGLAPIPLLVLLGNLLGNRSNVDIFQLKKNTSSWRWEENKSRLGIKHIWHNKINSSDSILMLSLSGKISLNNINTILDTTKCNVAEIYLEEPFDDFLRTKMQLDEIMESYKKIKEQLINLGTKRIHLFASIPVSVAINIGRSFNSNFDVPIITYDYNRGTYTKAITIGETNEEIFK